MNKVVVTRLLFAAALVVLVAVNAQVLSRIADNRTQGAESRLWLSERELPQVRWLALDNSGVDLRIRWRNLGREGNRVDDRAPSWLSGKKLEELGFVFADGRLAGELDARPDLERAVFFVLEYNGPAYHEAVRRAERALAELEQEQRANPGDTTWSSKRFQAKKRIRAEEMEQSRLFVVNAGQDAKQLRKLYNDSGRYIITRGVVRLSFHQEHGRLWARGWIQALQPGRLHLCLADRQKIEAITHDGKRDSGQSNLPRYEVEVVYGSRLEPWIAAIRERSTVEQDGNKNE
nr:DUF4824 family protein [uncultured Desulfobulbus sp.]